MFSKKKIYVITSLQVNASQERDNRAKRYLLAMSIRVLAFLGAVVISGPIRWFLIALAILIPYISVIKANTKDLASSPERLSKKPEFIVNKGIALDK